MSLHSCRNVWPVVVLFAVPFIQGQNTSPQTNSKDQVLTLRTQARIVLVDVVVTESKGQPVVGLHKEDLQVSEDGRPQTISFFEEHTGGVVSPVALPAMPSDVHTNYPTIKTTDSINVLLLDSLNTQATDQVYVRPQMVKYLRSELAAPTAPGWQFSHWDKNFVWCVDLRPIPPRASRPSLIRSLERRQNLNHRWPHLGGSPARISSAMA